MNRKKKILLSSLIIFGIIFLCIVLLIIFLIFQFKKHFPGERTDFASFEEYVEYGGGSSWVIDEEVPEGASDLRYYCDISLAHFSIYFLLGFISSSLLKEFNFSLKKIIYISLIFCFLYACSDELHQLFISDRYGSINDVFIDFSGAFFGSLIYNYIIYIFKFFRRYL